MPCIIAESGQSQRTEILTAIVCASRDNQVEKYFLSIADLLMDLLGPRPDVPDVEKAVNHLVELFQKLRSPSTRPIIGLAGELVVLYSAAFADAALSAWRRDPTERYDFSVANLRLEVKASATRQRIHSLSYDQANPPDNTLGVAASLYVEHAAGGTCIEEVIRLIEERLTTGPAILKLRAVVASTLGKDLLSALEWSFDLALAVSSLSFFDLRSIPAIRGRLETGVSAVRFNSDFSNCSCMGNEMITALDKPARDVILRMQ